MSDLEVGPSSFSTLHFVPHFIKDLLDENDTALKETKINENKASKNDKNTRSMNRKSVSDEETMAFVAMRNILKISNDKLAKLYNYNKREYDRFFAVIDNQNMINCDQVLVLYHLFSRISCSNDWIELCSDLGFDKYFAISHFWALFNDISSTQIGAKDEEQFSLIFFMKLLIFFWCNYSTCFNGDIFCYFWIESVSKMIKFISEMAVGIKIEIYCELSEEWMNATVIKLNKGSQQIYVNDEWFSVYSPILAPIGFKYWYIPNMRKRNNVPCIVAVIDDELNRLAKYRIPKDGWYYKLNKGTQIGPISIEKLFISCVEKEIDQNSTLYHALFGVTTLRRLPHIVNFFRNHVEKCRRYIKVNTTTTTSLNRFK